MLNYHLFQKFKLIENDRLNHLNNIITLSFPCDSKLSLNKWGRTREMFD
jgi:hypothetical protein